MTSKEEVLRCYREALPTGAVLGFFEGHRPLSNFHVEPFEMYRLQWPSAENAYQFCKIQYPTEEEVETFTQCAPWEAKKAGQTVPCREDWETVKVGVMRAILLRKFKQCPLARQCLVSTTGDLVEVNWWKDTFWGVYEGRGENQLGKVLMGIRKHIQEGNL